MTTKKTVNQRIPREIVEDMEKAMNWRFKNNLITRKELTFPEGFRLIRRTPEWNIALEKLRRFPKKEDMK